MEQALEVVYFRVKPEDVPALLATRDAALAAVRAGHPAMRSAHLAQLEDGRWIDVVLWDSRDQALAAARQVMEIPEFARWAAHISEVISMEHAVVRSLIHG